MMSTRQDSNKFLKILEIIITFFMVKLIVFLVFPLSCFAKDYKIYDKNLNYKGHTRTEGNHTKYYDKNSNYEGYSNEKGDFVEFYNKNSNLKGYSKDFYNKNSEILDKNLTTQGFSKKEKGVIKRYDKNYNPTEFYEEN